MLLGLAVTALAGQESGLAPVAVPVAVLAAVFGAKLLGLYDDDPYKLRPSTLDEIPRLAQLGVLVTLGAWLAEGFVFERELDNADALVLLVTTVPALLALRALARRISRSAAVPERCLVLGDRDGAQNVYRQVSIAGDVDAELVGWVTPPDEGPPPIAGDLPWLGDYDLLGLVAVQEDVERIIIAPADRSRLEVLEAIRVAKSLGLKVSVLPRLFEVIGSSVRLDQVGGVTMLGIPRHGLSRSSRAVKRLFDLAGAAFLAVLLAPVWMTIAIAVRDRLAGARLLPPDSDRCWGRRVSDAQVPLHGRGRRRAESGLARVERA